jgi:protease PrsW
MGSASRPRLPMWLSWPVLVAGVVVVPLVALSVWVTPASLLLGLVPLAIVLPTLAWLDRAEPEPMQARLHAILWGGTVAVLVSAIVNSIVVVAVSETVAAVVSAPLIEEATKGLGVWWAFRRRDIDGLSDGLVYAGWVGIGFAVVEDIQYFLVAADDGLLAETFVLRALLTPFAHPLFTAWVGLAIGYAVSQGRSPRRYAMGGYLLAVGLHASWNGSIVFTAETGAVLVLLGAIAVFVGIFVSTVTMVIIVHRRERDMFVRSVPALAARYGIPASQGLVFADWGLLRRARRALPRRERRRFDRQHAALAQLAALHARPGEPSPADEQRLLAAWHDSVRPG